ncbi:MAG: heme-binding protein [Thiogranum sp.]|nr:heme-binding protein [Thiogranum sp.]
MKNLTVIMAVAVLVLGSIRVHAEGLVTTPQLSLDMARTIADAAIESCRKKGYQVSVVVTDRSGEPLVMMRDIYSNRYFTELAHGKTQAVIMSNTTSAELRDNRPDMVNELNLLDGMMVLAGGVPLQAAGSLVGAVGVSGAPGGDLDEACARAGAEAVQEMLEFAE